MPEFILTIREVHNKTISARFNIQHASSADQTLIACLVQELIATQSKDLKNVAVFPVKT